MPSRLPTITSAELLVLLGQLNGATPIGFTALMEVTDRLRVKAWVDAREEHPTTGWSKPPIELGDMAELRQRPYARVFKLSRVNAMTGIASFEDSVNRARERQNRDDQPAFVQGERQWGTHAGPALIAKAGPLTRYYIPCNVRWTSRPIYLVPNSVTGRLMPIPTANLAPFLPHDRRPAMAAHQGLDTPIEYREYAVDNVVRAALNGEQLRIRQDGNTTTLPLPAHIKP